MRKSRIGDAPTRVGHWEGVPFGPATYVRGHSTDEEIERNRMPNHSSGTYVRRGARTARKDEITSQAQKK